MKNFKFLFVLAAFTLLLVFAQSCKKASAEDNTVQSEASANFDQVDNSFTEESATEIETDPIGYEPEALSITLGTLTRCAESEDASANCTTFKYSPATGEKSAKVGYGANSINVSLTFAELQIGASRVDSIVNTNSSTGKYATAEKVAKVGGRLVVSNVTEGVDSLHYSFKLAASTDLFRAGSAACKVYWHIGSVIKSKTVTIKCIGINENVNTFGTQKWGWEFYGGAANKYTAAGTTIDSTYVPAIRDGLRFGSDKIAIIDSLISTTAPVTTSQIAKGTKYVVRYKIMDPVCTSSTKSGKLTLYSKVVPTNTLTVVGGTALLTKYVR